VLDAYLFVTIEEAREIAEQWLEGYNAILPHDPLQGQTPYQYAAQTA
jgi:putative transposase